MIGNRDGVEIDRALSGQRVGRRDEPQDNDENDRTEKLHRTTLYRIQFG